MIRLTIEIDEEPTDDVYAGRVPSIGIATFGQTPADALSMTLDATASYVRSLVEHDEFSALRTT